MQTFLPFADFHQSAKCLDWRRLGNQRNEATTILENVLGIKDGWKHHLAVKMWNGHELSLFRYLEAICLEQVSRGYKDTVLSKVTKIMENHRSLFPRNPKDPWWIGHAGFHASHRSNLLRKKPEWYSQFKWSESATLPYLWPTASVGQIIVGEPFDSNANKR